MFQVKDKFNDDIYTVYGTRDFATFDRDGNIDGKEIEFLVYAKGNVWDIYEWQYINSHYLIPVNFKEE